MLRRLMLTDDDISRTIVRLFLGIVMFPHGAQKLLGWFGGYGFEATIQGLSQRVGVPIVLIFLVIIIEFFGSLALILGFLGRIAAFGVLCVMLGAVFTSHLANGFFMNWYGNKPGEGFEYHLLAIGMALAVMAKGSGAYSADRSITRGEAP